MPLCWKDLEVMYTGSVDMPNQKALSVTIDPLLPVSGQELKKQYLPND